MKRSAMVGVWIMLAAIWGGIVAGVARAGESPWAKRWVYVSSNLYVDDNVGRLEALFARARAAGYNGILFSDFKCGTFWALDDPARWKRNAARLQKSCDDLDLELVVAVLPFGRSGAMLFHDVNLAAGMPVREVALVAREGVLAPETSTALRNGSFEEHRGHTAAGFSFQDDPGKGSFIDEAVAREGRVSLRFEDVSRANPHGHGRICQAINVRPWHQYLFKAWMKADALTADEIKLLVMGGGRVLQWQFPKALRNGRRDYAGRADNLTTDWIEQRVAFNSLTNTSVLVYAGLWGGKTGRIWWDGLRVEDAPALNVLRRDDLPLVLTGADGTVYEEGRDVEPVADPGLGRVPWPGSYDTDHEPPAIRLRPGGRIADGARVRLSAYHASLVYDGQVDASMDHPAVFEYSRTQLRRLREAFHPAGWFMSHDEIRCGGWEPSARARFASSGELFAYNIRTCAAIAREEGGGKPVYVWSDMYDPNHNAREGFYLVRGDLTGSWEGLPREVIVMKWGGGKIARPGLAFFAQRGHRQMIAAFYDNDVRADHAMWTEASRGVPGLMGVMYTTWRNDYSRLEEFARMWWGGKAED